MFMIVLGVTLLYFRALPAAPVPYIAQVSLILGSILANLPPTAGFGVIRAGGIMWGSGAFVIGALAVASRAHVF